MQNDLELIKELENEIGEKLKKVEFKRIKEYRINAFAVNEKGEIIGLNLDTIKLIYPHAILSKFRFLKTLRLSGTQLSDISFLVHFSNLTLLSLSDNQVKDISPIIGLRNLSYLSLWGNKITDISSLQGLKNLTELYLGNNQVTDISPLIGLRNLTVLDLIENKLTELPKAIVEMGLEIDVYYNYVRDGAISLLGNPLEKPPVEIIRKGKEAIRDYFKSLEGEKRLLNEVKVLLVGDGGAGKTSLVKRLLEDKFDPHEPQTHGINIKPWKIKKDEIKVNLWDFGGQEIMHATHQFFLSKRSLYILVLDCRTDEKTDHEYWLKHIESFGGDSPVLVVINKIDENPAFDVNRKFLLDKYKNIKGFFRISCLENEGINTFSKALIEALSQMDMIKTIWAESWFNVKTQLENMKEHFISYDKYNEICTNKKITHKSGKDTLLDFLNDLGVILHFEDLALEDTHVLEPKWVTEAVYKIINSPVLAKSKGILKLKQLAEILKKKKKHDYFYPPDKYRYIIELMKKFELCYEIDRDRMLIPDLLDVEESQFDFDYDTSLKFIIQYDFLPRSVMPRFIVRRHKDIKKELQWRTGVVLEDEDATAVIKSDERERKIFIEVNGEQKKNFFSIIRKTLRDINKSFEKLKVTELVPLPDNKEITVKYTELIGYERAKRPEYFSGELEKAYSIKQLLDGIEEKKERQSATIQERIIVPVEVTKPSKPKSKWYKAWNIIWKIIVGIGVIAALIASIKAMLE